jgi:SNF2 family DNA or RNA helicase
VLLRLFLVLSGCQLLCLLPLLTQVGDNVILADEMGLGKTIQTIAFLGALWKVGRLTALCRSTSSSTYLAVYAWVHQQLGSLHAVVLA